MLRKATLGLVIEHDSAKKATDEVDRLGAHGEAAARRVQSAFSATDKQVKDLAASMRRMRETAGANAMASMISASDPFQKQAAAFRDATAAADKHHLALGRINFALEGLAVEALGANSKLASIGGKFLEFGVGGIVTAGVLAGLGAMAFAWEKVAEKAREAQKASDEAVKAAEDIRRKRLLGPAGEAGATIDELKNITLPLERAKLAALGPPGTRNFQGDPNDAEIEAQKIRITYIESLIKEAGIESRRLKQEASDKEASDRREAMDREKRDWEKFFAELIRLRAAQRDLVTFEGEAEDAKLFTDQQQRDRSGGLNKAGVVAGSAIADTATRKEAITRLFNITIPAEIRNAIKPEPITAAVVDSIADAMQAAKERIVAGSALSVLSSIGGTAGSSAAGIIQAGLSGAPGGPLGVAASAGAALVSTIVSLGKSSREASEQMKQLRASVTDYILSVRAASGDRSAATTQQILSAHADASAARDALKASFGGADVNGLLPNGLGRLSASQLADYQRQLAAINILEIKRVTQIQNEAIALEKAAKTDGLKRTIGDLTTLIDSLTGFRSSISLSTLSPLTPVQQLAEARRQYDEVLGKARGGDQTAAGQLPELARQLLESSRGVYASGAAYQQTYQQVMRDNDEITKLFEAQRTIAQQQLDVLMGLRDGSAETAQQAHEDAVAIQDAIRGLIDATRASGEQVEAAI
jgi:hypothetical protein